jgi:hypothetical protein
MGRLKKYIFLWVSMSLCGNIFTQQLNLPLHRAFSLGFQNYFSKVDSLTFHSSMKPMIENPNVGVTYEKFMELNTTDVTKHFAWLLPDKSWLKRKAKWEHLFAVKDKDFSFNLNPVFNFEYGRDLANDNSRKFFVNSRGVMANVNLGEKISFSTSFYENQSRVPQYLSNYIDQTGELRRNAVGNWRTLSGFGTFPGQGRTKRFKEDGYDYAWASGYVSYSTTKNLNIQFGHDKHFIGEGYRSMLLSDNAFNYPFLKFTSKWCKGRIQYTNIFASLNQMKRLDEFTTPEAGYFRKSGSFHYLNFLVGKKLEIGLYEATIWQKMRNDFIIATNYSQFNPIIGINSARFGFADTNNVLVGLNFKLHPFKKMDIYGQMAIDDPNKDHFAYQLGAKWFEPFKIKKFILQVEANHAARNMYTSVTAIQNYGHYNQPLAHPLGAGFWEFLVIGNYRNDDWFLEARLSYATYRQFQGTNQYWKDIYLDSETEIPPEIDFKQAKLFYSDLKGGYVFNPKTNACFILGWMHRKLISFDEDPYKTSYLYIGLRTTLFNSYYDI